MPSNSISKLQNKIILHYDRIKPRRVKKLSNLDNVLLMNFNADIPF